MNQKAIGLNAKLENQYEDYLSKIFEGVDLSKYDWKVEEEEILNFEDGILQDRLFWEDVWNGDALLEQFKDQHYLMLCADIRAYKKGSKIIGATTYEEYVNSTCELIMLCTDTIFLEFYCKNEDVLNQVYQNCVKYNFDKLEWTTEENDGRTRMSVW